MEEISIWKRNEKIGKMTFDINSKLIKLQFEDDKKEEYVEIFSFLINEIRRRAFPSLVFDEDEGIIKNVDGMVFLAIKQELFLNLIELRDEEKK